MAAEKKSRRSGSSKSGQEFLCENLNFAGKEAFKRLRTNLQFCFADSENNSSLCLFNYRQFYCAEGLSLLVAFCIRLAPDHVDPGFQPQSRDGYCRALHPLVDIPVPAVSVLIPDIDPIVIRIFTFI